MSKRIMCALADERLTTKNATYDQVCILCGRKLMLASSGQKWLAENPDAETVCSECVLKNPADYAVKGFAGTPDDFQRDLQQVIPNPRGGRN